MKYIQTWTGNGWIETTFEELQVGKPITIKIVERPIAKKHEWEFYMNGSFCKKCGAAIGSGVECK